MKNWQKVTFPLVVIVIGALSAGAMILSRKQPETRIPEPPVPLVRVLPVALEDLRLNVKSQGTVKPRTETTLVTEIAGRVLEVHSSFVAGGFFEEGDLLLAVDPHDYRQALIQARAAVAQTELRLAQEQAEAEVARQEWKDLGGGEASPLTLRVPQVREAEAAVASAKAAVVKAERDLERTSIRAPYAGRVREKSVDRGQYVTPGTPLAKIYSVDFAEIRLPLPDADLAFVDLPLVFRDAGSRKPGPEVVLRAEFAGRSFEWQGRLVRTEGEIDPRSRMVHAVAQVSDPYGRGDDPERPPLAVGLYVEAEIAGRTVEGVAVIPRTALRNGTQVLVVDESDQLQFRDVEVLRISDDRAVIGSGLNDGERVCVSNLTAVTNGMRVRIFGEGPEPESAPDGTRVEG
jgi:RND family efflux transporter MFP subunit